MISQTVRYIVILYTAQSKRFILKNENVKEGVLFYIIIIRLLSMQQNIKDIIYSVTTKTWLIILDTLQKYPECFCIFFQATTTDFGLFNLEYM